MKFCTTLYHYARVHRRAITCRKWLSHLSREKSGRQRSLEFHALGKPRKIARQSYNRILERTVQKIKKKKEIDNFFSTVHNGVVITQQICLIVTSLCNKTPGNIRRYYSAFRGYFSSVIPRAATTTMRRDINAILKARRRISLGNVPRG